MDFTDLFADNGWPGAWVNGIFAFHHFHSSAHEVLGIARGAVTAVFGGPNDAEVAMRTGDIVVVPAGVGHCRVSGRDLGVVGACPAGQRADLLRMGDGDFDSLSAAVRRVALPGADPVFGRDGPLMSAWHND
ncbi:MAG: cupin, partial [bacterium]|nr:cupin [bacterium]